MGLYYSHHVDAGWSSLVARRAHNPKVVGSNPAPATRLEKADLVNSKSAFFRFGIMIFKRCSW